MRHVYITPAVASLGRGECEIVLRRTERGPLPLTFIGSTEAHGSPFARFVGPVAARLLLRRFVTLVTGRMLLAATSRPEPYS